MAIIAGGHHRWWQSLLVAIIVGRQGRQNGTGKRGRPVHIRGLGNPRLGNPRLGNPGQSKQGGKQNGTPPTAADGRPADGRCRPGGVAWQAGGQEAENKLRKTPQSQAMFGE